MWVEPNFYRNFLKIVLCGSSDIQYESKGSKLRIELET